MAQALCLHSYPIRKMIVEMQWNIVCRFCTFYIFDLQIPLNSKVIISFLSLDNACVPYLNPNKKLKVFVQRFLFLYIWVSSYWSLLRIIFWFRKLSKAKTTNLAMPEVHIWNFLRQKKPKFHFDCLLQSIGRQCFQKLEWYIN